jgi:hypothetical protein
VYLFDVLDEALNTVCMGSIAKTMPALLDDSVVIETGRTR